MPVLGKFTPSRFKDAMTNNRANTGIGETALKLCYDIVLDRIGVEREEIHASALDWGHEWESVAKAEYEAKRLVYIEQYYEPVNHKELDYVAGTPDGKIANQNGLIEIKCPYNSMNHFMNLIEGEQIEMYRLQMQGYMWLTDTDFCDFVSFDPRFPELTRLSIWRIERDNAVIEKLKNRLILLESKVQEILSKIEVIK